MIDIEILLGMFGGIISALFGAYIANIMSWKIKNQVEHIDVLYLELFNINFLVGKFINADKEARKSLTSELNSKLAHSGNIYLHDNILDYRFHHQLLKFSKSLSELLDMYIDDETDNEEVVQNKHDIYNESTRFFPELLKYRKKVTSFDYVFLQIIRGLRDFDGYESKNL